MLKVIVAACVVGMQKRTRPVIDHVSDLGWYINTSEELVGFASASSWIPEPPKMYRFPGAVTVNSR
jgi:hypothetical protein